MSISALSYYADPYKHEAWNMHNNVLFLAHLGSSDQAR